MIRLFQFLALIYLAFSGSAHAINLRSSAQAGNLMRFNPHNPALPGFSIELIRLLQADPQLHITGQDSMRSLRRLESDLEQGRIDMVVGLADSASRQRRFIVISRPLLYMQQAAVAVRREDALFQLPENKLSGLSQNGVIAIIQGSAYGAHLSNPAPLQMDDGAISLAANLGKLVRHRVRFVLHAKEELDWHIKQLQLQQRVRVIPLHGMQTGVHLMLSRKLPSSTIRYLQAALQKLEDSGNLHALRFKYGLNPAS